MVDIWVLSVSYLNQQANCNCHLNDRETGSENYDREQKKKKKSIVVKNSFNKYVHSSGNRIRLLAGEPAV